jgi:hypothetical protein
LRSTATWLELERPPDASTVRRSRRKLLERRAPALAVARSVDRHLDPLAFAFRDDGVDEVLHASIVCP